MQISKFVESYNAKDFTWNGCMEAWYDWFCSDTSLVRRTKSVGTMIKNVYKILTANGYNTEQVDVSLKNCCPVSGPLYDCIRFFPKNKSCVCVVFNDEREDYRWMVYDYQKNKKVYESDSVKSVPEKVAAAVSKYIDKVSA